VWTPLLSGFCLRDVRRCCLTFAYLWLAKPRCLVFHHTFGTAGKQHPVFGHSHQGLLLPLRTKRRGGPQAKGQEGPLRHRF
jgi:hypothetical protein